MLNGKLLSSLAAALVLSMQVSPAQTNQIDGAFRKVVLDADRDTDGDGKVDDSMKDPLEFSIAADGRIFFVERDGFIKVLKPGVEMSEVVGKLNPFTGCEDGLLGIALDPNFLKNGWIYLYYALPEMLKDANGQKAGENVLSRFTIRNNQMDLLSEKILLRVRTQRDTCCHSGGSVHFDSAGNLYLSTGDNTNPFESDSYAPIDERPGRGPWDAQKSAANANDLRGKVLRIKPLDNGTYEIPKGNLFPATSKKEFLPNRSMERGSGKLLWKWNPPAKALSGTRPEVYAMGCRNPFRISLDPKNGILYWGEVGPDANSIKEGRGPAGYDEINQARAAGNYGWPYFVADNKAYWQYDFATKTSGEKFDAAHPVNNSPNNTGIHELPPAQPAFIYYPYAPSTKFPAVNVGGGRTAMAGPVYYFDAKNKSPNKLPREFDHTLFIYEWSRNWIIAVHLDAKENIAKMERFCGGMTFKRPTDMELGPDGCLYVIEYGTAWGKNTDSQIVRIEYTGGESAPAAPLHEKPAKPSKQKPAKPVEQEYKFEPVSFNAAEK